MIKKKIKTSQIDFVVDIIFNLIDGKNIKDQKEIIRSLLNEGDSMLILKRITIIALSRAGMPWHEIMQKTNSGNRLVHMYKKISKSSVFKDIDKDRHTKAIKYILG